MSRHLQPEDVLSLLDAESVVGDHLHTCASCREQTDAIFSGVREFLTYHRQVRIPWTPAPPEPWMDLGVGMDTIDKRGAARPRVTPLKGILSWRTVGAATAALILAYLGYQKTPSVQAAALLTKAEGVELLPRPDARIRIHTKRREFVRQAALKGTTAQDAGDLQQLFAAAHFDWEQPFTVRAFGEWRRSLPDKRDEIEYGAGECRIQTSSASNPLSRATLVLRSSDLTPTRETLEFRNYETVEIAAASGVAESSAPPTPARVTPHTVAPASDRPHSAVSLRVLAALHALGADLGELELREQANNVLVYGAGISAARRDEIRAALKGIDGVSVEFAKDSDIPFAASPTRQQAQVPESSSALRVLLESRLRDGESVEDAVNRILDTSDSVMAHAFALRSLAMRYPPSEEQALDDNDRDLLAKLHADHAGQLNDRMDELTGMLIPLLPSGPAVLASPSTWQQGAEEAFNALRNLDSQLSSMLAPSLGGTSARANSLTELELALRRAQTAVRLTR